MSSNNNTESEEEKKKKSGSWLDFLGNFNPLNWLSGIGGLIKTAAIAVGLFLLLGSEKVQHFIGGLVGKIFGEEAGKKTEDFLHDMIGKVKGMFGGKVSDEMKAQFFNDMDYKTAKDKLKGQIPDAVYNVVITDNPKDWLDFRDTVKSAQEGGKLKNINEIFNSKSLVKLLTTKPDLSMKLLAAVHSGGDATMSGNVSKALHDIICGDDLKTLLNPTNIDNTVKVMLTLLPPPKAGETKMDAATLKKQLQMGLDKDGNPMDALRTAMIAQLETFSASTSNPGSTNPNNPNAATNPTTGFTVPDAFKTMLGSDDNVKALLTLRKELTEPPELGDRFTPLMAALGKNDSGQVNILAAKPESIAAVTKFATAVDTTVMDEKLVDGIKSFRIANDKRFSQAVSNLAKNNIDVAALFAENFTAADGSGKTNASLIFTRLMQQPANDAVQNADPANISTIMATYQPQMKDVFSTENLNAILKATKALGNNPNNFANGTPEVMGALVELAVHNNPETLKQAVALRPTIVSDFFQNETNTAIVTQLIKDWKGGGKMMNEIKGDWSAIVDTLKDKDATIALVGILDGKEYKPDTWEGFKAWGHFGTNDKILQHPDAFKRLAETLKEVNPNSIGAPLAMNVSNNNSPQVGH